MKSYKLKTLNNKAYLFVTSTLALISIASFVYFFSWIYDNNLKLFLLTMVPVSVISFNGIKSIFLKTYTINIYSSNIVVLQHDKIIRNILLNEIVKVQYVRKENSDCLIIHTLDEKEPLFRFEALGQRKRFQKIIDTICSGPNYTENIKSDEARTIYTEYINKDILIKEVRSNNKTPQLYKRKKIYQYLN